MLPNSVCDFRKIAQIEAYAPSDNVSELTARVNDEGLDTCYANRLRGSHLNKADMVFVFSVGGGDAKKPTWFALSNTPAMCAPPFAGLSAAMAASPHRPRTRTSSFSWSILLPSRPIPSLFRR